VISPVAPKVGVIFKSYEPLAAIADYARLTDQLGLTGGFWLAEAYHWFRQYGHEARGVMVTLATAVHATKRIPIGLGIGSPYMRHPTIYGSEACALDELSGGRIIMGLGAGKVGINYLEVDQKQQPPVKVHREAIEIFRKVVSGAAFDYKGEIFSSSMPAIAPARRAHRDHIPIYIGGTGPFMQRLAGETADGLLLPGLTSPGFVRYARDNLGAGFARADRRQPSDFPVGGVILCSISVDGARARAAARPYAATYVVNKIRNIQNDEILGRSGVTAEELAPMRARIASGNENLVDLVSDDIMKRFAVVAGTPAEATAILQKLVDAGLNLPLMEVVGADQKANLETIELLGTEVVPQLKPAKIAA
jgi:alkanesulfonate monooxygenase SsuD/methylene tetrahydromethanopterin reductase-like flavin-dependent oxidoreductase (luciferase family)